MKKWVVDVSIEGHYEAIVEAETEEEACEKACDKASEDAWLDYNVEDCRESKL